MGRVPRGLKTPGLGPLSLWDKGRRASFHWDKVLSKSH